MVKHVTQKLEKLRIVAFLDPERRKRSGRPFVAQFNPETISQSYSVGYTDSEVRNSQSNAKTFKLSEPSELVLELVLDGSGVTEVNPSGASVQALIQQFLHCTYRVNPKIHQPNYLLVQWGKLWDVGFACRLANVDITYERFQRDGAPLRARLNATFAADGKPLGDIAALNPTSPDLTHALTVKSGETLPQLTRAIYGSAGPITQVARANDLDNLRGLRPGMQLVFPPIRGKGGPQ